MCLTAKYSTDRYKLRKGEKQIEITKKKKVSHESTASITRERKRIRRLERKKDGNFDLASTHS